MSSPHTHPDRSHASRDHVAAHDHAVLVYDEIEDMLAPLDHFVEMGARERDLSVFVHSFKANDEARGFLARRVAGVLKHETEGGFTTAPYREAFEREGRIDHDHVASVVSMLHANAKATQRRSPRIFVDASKNYFDSGRVDEWFAFERWLGPRLQSDAGLVCAYRAQDLADPRVLQQVLETHQYRFDAPRGGTTSP